MNKKFISLMLAAPLFMGIGLTSCSSEEPLQAAEQLTAQEKIVDVTMTAELPAGTRATLTPDKNVLKFAWEKDDVVKVVNAANGKYVGQLTVSEVKADPRRCVFAGPVTVPTEGPVDFKFYYVAKNKVEVGLNDNGVLGLKDMTLNFATQDGTQNFADNDILIAAQSYEDLNDGNLGTLKFDRNLAYSHFVLKYNGEVLDIKGKTVTISAAEGELYQSTTLNFQNGTYTEEEGDIVVTPSENEFWVNFIPSENVRLQFTVTMDDVNFNGQRFRGIIADSYYVENEKGDAVIVEMKADDGRDDEHDFTLYYDPNFTPTSQGIQVYNKNRVGSADYKVQTYDLFTREGMEIEGWNTEADGSGTAYAAGDTLTITWPETTTTLYAQWKEKEYVWTINWNENYGENKNIKSVTETGTAPHQLEATFPAAPVREGHTFTGWTLDGESVSGKADVTLTKDDTIVTIIANWEELPDPTTITTPHYGPGIF